MSAKVLVNMFHPHLGASRGNKRLAETVRELPGVTFRHVDAEYAAKPLDVQKEQQLLESHAVIVIQHPVMWYNMPPLLKSWYDLVLLRGWAYPADQSKLAGKTFQLAVTTGSPAEAYRSGAVNGYSVSELLRPQQQTALLCGMTFAPIFVTHGVIPTDWGGIDDATLAGQATLYANLLRRYVELAP